MILQYLNQKQKTYAAIYSLLLIIFCLLCSSALASSYPTVSYTITPESKNDIPFIKIDVEIKSRLSKVTLDFPSGEAGIDYYTQIKNVALKYPGGIIWRRKELNDNSKCIISMPKNTPINLSYEVYKNPGVSRAVEETIIRSDLIHAVGYGIFVIPNELNNNGNKTRFFVTWKNIPKKWKTLSSYSVNKSFEVPGKVDDLLQAFYAAGNLRIYQINNSNAPVYLSFYGGFSLKDYLMIYDLKKIINSQRSFFKEYDFPYYAISLIESDDNSFVSGLGLRDSFIMRLSKTIERETYCSFFAHEHLHTWVGGKIRSNEGGVLNYWWSEGFTDYYSRVIALRSGKLSIKEFIEECNNFLRAYYLSSVRNVSNKKIDLGFFKSIDIQKLPYYRGFVFAIYLNYLIKKNNPNNSLDNVMLDLFKYSKNKEFSLSYFIKIIEPYIPKESKKEIFMLINQGQTINLRQASTVLPLVNTKIGVYSLGFDKQALIEKKVIKDIDPNSNAYKVGIRNGDKVIATDILGSKEQGDPNKIIIIKTPGKIFKFVPEHHDKKNVYQFKTALSKEDINEVNDFFMK